MRQHSAHLKKNGIGGWWDPFLSECGATPFMFFPTCWFVPSAHLMDISCANGCRRRVSSVVRKKTEERERRRWIIPQFVSLVPRRNPLMRKRSGVTSLGLQKCWSLVIVSVELQIAHLNNESHNTLWGYIEVVVPAWLAATSFWS